MLFFLHSDNSPFLVVIYLTIVKSLFFEVSVAPCYVSPTSLLMPVTTRSQSKRLQQAIDDHSFSFTSGLQLSLSTSVQHNHVILVQYRHQWCQHVIVIH
jgi:hypothetical protein